MATCLTSCDLTRVAAVLCALQAVVRDVRGLGVMYAPQLRSFTCLSGPKEAIQQRASLPELTALLQVGRTLELCKLVQCRLYGTCFAAGGRHTTIPTHKQTGCCKHSSKNCWCLWVKTCAAAVCLCAVVWSICGHEAV